MKTNLEAYKIQLQQVEAAITAEPDNESLLKLKVDLEEVISITEDLMNASDEEDEKAKGIDDDKASSDAEDLVKKFLASSSLPQAPSVLKKWKVGEKCMAIWSKNKQYYEAVIDGISEGKAVVTFSGYNVTEVNKLDLLKTLTELPPKKYVFDSTAKMKAMKNKSQWRVEKEKRKQKALKRVQKLRQIEEQKEQEKHQWKDFNRKALAKSFRGVKKASIFSTTERSGSKVGIGNSGKPMTHFHRQDRLSAAGPSKMPHSAF